MGLNPHPSLRTRIITLSIFSELTYFPKKKGKTVRKGPKKSRGRIGMRGRGTKSEERKDLEKGRRVRTNKKYEKYNLVCKLSAGKGKKRGKKAGEGEGQMNF